MKVQGCHITKPGAEKPDPSHPQWEQSDMQRKSKAITNEQECGLAGAHPLILRPTSRQ